MKIVYIIKQIGDAKIASETPKHYTFFSSPSSKQSSTITTTDRLIHLIESNKSLNKNAANKIFEERYNDNDYYFMFSGDTCYGVIITEAERKFINERTGFLTQDRLNILFENIKTAPSQKALLMIIDNPDKAIETKIDILQKNVVQVKSQVIQTMGKVIERQSQLDQLNESATVLTTQSNAFKNKSIALKVYSMPWYYRLLHFITDPIIKAGEALHITTTHTAAKTDTTKTTEASSVKP